MDSVQRAYRRTSADRRHPSESRAGHQITRNDVFAGERAGLQG
jgi:hypothetical protein